MIRVLVNGADGRMGSQVVKAVYEDKDLEFVGGVSVTNIGRDAGELAVSVRWESLSAKA